MTDPIISEIPVTVFGNLESFNEVLSKGRCRIFYKGMNRNGTFITDEFAEKLIKSIPYVPVKGIYNDEERDFTDHGKRRDLGRIYGVVPADPHFAWEKHLDEDGVEREYACVDVLYYTGLYKEASEIAGKAQSMELYADSIKGEWKIQDGRRCYVYEDACFLGFQVLGDAVEPCFEGSSFYSLDDSMKKFFEEVNTYNTCSNQFQNDGQGGQDMPNELFRFSDGMKYRALWTLLNSEVDEDGCRLCRYSITEVYDDYAIAFDYESGSYERVYYSKDDATDSLEITKREKCFIVDVNETEKSALEAARASNGGTYEKIDETVASVDGLHARITELEEAQAQRDEQIVVMTADKEALTNDLNNQIAQYAAAQETIAALTTERDNLASYKKNVEDTAKLEIISAYEDTLSEDVLNTYRNNLDAYTCEELDMQLTYAQKKANPSMFQKQATPAYIPKDENTNGGINSILAKYEKK